ncbi:unnamed protein product [Arctogadus glacialis]
MEDLFYNDTVKKNETYLCRSYHFTVVITTLDISTVLIGLPVIAKLLWTTFHSKKTDVLNINLACFHTLQNMLSLLQIILILINIDDHTKITMFLFVYVLIGGPMNLSFICLERYIAVIHPTFYPLLKKYRCREGCSLLVWLLAVPPSLMNALSEDLHTSMEKGSMDIVACIILCLVVIVMLWSNIAILIALKNSPSSTDKQHPVKKRAFQTVRAIFIASFLCYIPAGIMVKYKTVARNSSCIIAPFCIFLVSIASVVHPMFYLSATGQLFPCLTPTK